MNRSSPLANPHFSFTLADNRDLLAVSEEAAIALGIAMRPCPQRGDDPPALLSEPLGIEVHVSEVQSPLSNAPQKYVIQGSLRWQDYADIADDANDIDDWILALFRRARCKWYKPSLDEVWVGSGLMDPAKAYGDPFAHPPRTPREGRMRQLLASPPRPLSLRLTATTAANLETLGARVASALDLRFTASPEQPARLIASTLGLDVILEEQASAGPRRSYLLSSRISPALDLPPPLGDANDLSDYVLHVLTHPIGPLAPQPLADETWEHAR